MFGLLVRIDFNNPVKAVLYILLIFLCQLGLMYSNILLNWIYYVSSKSKIKIIYNKLF